MQLQHQNRIISQFLKIFPFFSFIIGSESSSVVDLFHSISFTSPIEDLKIPPIPAPRLSKQKFVIPNPTTSDILDHSDQVPEKKEISSNQLNIQEDLENNVTCTIPTPTPRNVYETIGKKIMP